MSDYSDLRITELEINLSTAQCELDAYKAIVNALVAASNLSPSCTINQWINEGSCAAIIQNLNTPPKKRVRF